MNLPRDVSGRDLAKALVAFGYAIVRQSGSHMRLTTLRNGQHHVTVPDHKPLKTGTLSGIVSDVAAHLGLTRQELIQQLFP